MKNLNWCEIVRVFMEFPYRWIKLSSWKLRKEIAFSNGHRFLCRFLIPTRVHQRIPKVIWRKFSLSPFSWWQIKRITKHVKLREKGEIVILRHELLELLFSAFFFIYSRVQGFYLWRIFTAVENNSSKSLSFYLTPTQFKLKIYCTTSQTL